MKNCSIKQQFLGKLVGPPHKKLQKKSAHKISRRRVSGNNDKSNEFLFCVLQQKKKLSILGDSLPFLLKKKEENYDR